MKRNLLVFLFIVFTAILQAQKDSTAIAVSYPLKNYTTETVKINLNIYPVPVRDNSFTIKSDRDISFVKVTNIIGQDIYRMQFNEPQQILKVSLENTKRGMYIVTVLFADGMRVVKKIMVEESE